MIQSVGSRGPSVSSDAPSRAASSQGSRRSRRAEGNAQHIEASNSRSGSLEVTTAEGDKVSISFSAIQKLQADQVKVYTKRGNAAAQSVSQDSQLQVNVKVEGSLNDQEVSDIVNLLQSLSGGAQAGATQTPASQNTTPQTTSQTTAPQVDGTQTTEQSSTPSAPTNYQSISAYHYQYQQNWSYQSTQVQFG